MTSIEAVKKAIQDFPDHGNRTLARLVFQNHPAVFASEAHALRQVRYHRGASGTADRKKAKHEKPMTPARTPLPKSAAKPRKPYQLPQGKTLILSDVHIPYHDQAALGLALDYADGYKPDHILLNGDTIDFYAISSWEKDPEVRNLAQELERTRQFLAHLRSRYPDATIIWKNGNHEERWEKYLWNKSPELCGISEFEMQHVLRFKEYGVEFVHGRQRIKAGRHLTIIHGHEIKSGIDPVNFARTLCQKLKVCAIGGDKHKVSEHTEKTADDKYITCWGIGCLQELHPEYMPMNQWSHGFATLELNGQDFDVSNFRIIEGKIR